MSGAASGGTLRPDPQFPQCWRGTVRIEGFPYDATAVREHVDGEDVLRVRLAFEPKAQDAG